ncbi:hypothetical protein D3C77_218380 [compost metagenome]
MLIHNLKTVAKTMLSQVTTQSDLECFIHSDMNPLRTERPCRSSDHLFDELIGLRLTRQQDIIMILDLSGIVPFQRMIKMTKCLNARDHLNPEQIGVVVTFPKLLHRIAAPHVPKVRQLFNFKRILRVHHQAVQAHNRHIANKLLDRVHRHYPIARHIQHCAIEIKTRLLGHFKLIIILGMLNEQSQTTEEVNFILILNSSLPTFSRYA